jgi:hypothetical protein
VVDTNDMNLEPPAGQPPSGAMAEQGAAMADGGPTVTFASQEPPVAPSAIVAGQAAGTVSPDAYATAPQPVVSGADSAIDAGQVEAEGAAAPTGFLSTTQGKVITIAAAVAALVVVAGLAAAAFMLFASLSTPKGGSTAGSSGSGTAAGGSGVSQSGSTTATSPTSTANTVPVSVAVITNADVYTFRDPFKPLLEAPPTPTPSSSTTSTSSGGSSSSATTASASGGSSGGSQEASGTLTLESISTEGGVKMAKFTLDGVTYTVSAGEQLGTTPWKVVEIGSDSVVMLYGDERITLTVGQGVAK